MSGTAPNYSATNPALIYREAELAEFMPGTAGAARLASGRACTAPQPTAGASRNPSQAVRTAPVFRGQDVRLSKRERIVALLDGYQLAREVLQSGDPGGSFSGHIKSRYLSMPAAWSRSSYGQLEKLIFGVDGRGGMLRDAPTAYWHLSRRYLVCERVARRLPFHRDGRGRVMPEGLRPNMELLAPATVVVGEKLCTCSLRVWHRDVDERIVEFAVDWLERRFRGMPNLPSDFYESAERQQARRVA